MNIVMPIPDDLAERLGTSDTISRRALEAFAADEYRSGRLSHPEMRRLLGFATHHELDGFLKTREIFEDESVADIERELQDLRRLGV